VAGKTPKQAVLNFVAPLREALGCVTASGIALRGSYVVGELYGLTVNAGEPVIVYRASAQGHMRLSISQHYRIVEAEGDRGPYKVETRGYMYSVENDASQEVIAFHWHPEGSSHVALPHLHLGYGAQIGLTELTEAHVPTGRISMEEFLRFAIETFQLRTRRTDWRSVMNRTNALFKKWQTWA
jgi:hypothetical protein